MPHQLYRLLHLRTCAVTYEARQAMNRIQLRQRHARIVRRARARRLACSNTNPKACILIAAKRFGVSYSWLLACANSEGGTGPGDYDKMNYQGSGAGGNFQFMESTFYAYIRAAGWKGEALWLNSEQQALTAAYMFSIGESDQWTGLGC